MKVASAYYLLAKPGIMMGNALTMAAGFCLAKTPFNLPLFSAALIGLCLVIAGACLFNNLIDRKTDGQMPRTRKRAEVLASLSLNSVALVASISCLLGVFVLFYLANAIAAVIALFGLFGYVIVYSFSKYYSAHSTLLGSFAGAAPPVIGYSAATGTLDSGALLLFLTLVFWQMSHFFAIALYRMKEYEAASIPVFPIQKGILATKWRILAYTIAFATASFLLFWIGYAGIGYLVAISLCTLAWLCLAFRGLFISEDAPWARQMFRLSLVVISVFSLILIGSAFPVKLL